MSETTGPSKFINQMCEGYLVLRAKRSWSLQRRSLKLRLTSLCSAGLCIAGLRSAGLCIAGLRFSDLRVKKLRVSNLRAVDVRSAACYVKDRMSAGEVKHRVNQRVANRSWLESVGTVAGV